MPRLELIFMTANCMPCHVLARVMEELQYALVCDLCPGPALPRSGNAS